MTTAERRDDLPPRVVSVMRPRVQWSDESARRFTLEGSTPRHAACSGPEGRRWCGSGASSTAAPRPWWAAIASMALSRKAKSFETSRWVGSASSAWFACAGTSRGNRCAQGGVARGAVGAGCLCCGYLEGTERGSGGGAAAPKAGEGRTGSGRLLLRSRAVRLCIAVGSFAGLALLLAPLGVFGLLSYTATQRQDQIGIRRALGARRADILALLARQGTVLVVVGARIEVDCTGRSAPIGRQFGDQLAEFRRAAMHGAHHVARKSVSSTRLL